MKRLEEVSSPVLIFSVFRFLRSPRGLIALSLLIILAALLIFVKFSHEKSLRYEQEVEQITRSEELILALQRSLKELSKSSRELVLPDADTRQYFASSVSVKDLSSNHADNLVGNLGVTSEQWAINSKSAVTSPSDLQLFRALFADLNQLHGLKLKIVSGQFSEKDESFTTFLALSGSGVSASMKGISFDGHATVEWQESGEEGWKISRWELWIFTATRMKRRLHSLSAVTKLACRILLRGSGLSSRSMTNSSRT